MIKIQNRNWFSYVTSHTGCVSRNLRINKKYVFVLRHIPHGMCEQKLNFLLIFLSFLSHIPHGMCEQKLLSLPILAAFRIRHIPHGMCEQKYTSDGVLVTDLSHIPHGMCEQKFMTTILLDLAANVTSHTGCVSRNSHDPEKKKSARSHPTRDV